MWYASTMAPSGFLVCDGSLISRTNYASLFAVIGTAFGAGDGVTTFQLPDMRATFVRGAGTQNAYSATFGQKQEATSFRQYSSAFAAYSYADTSQRVVDNNTPGIGVNSNNTRSGDKVSVRPYNIALTPIIKY